ncbi:anti-sigma-I factor RsgI6-like [Branchiostoma lanceolatum]|uniref:anti-sigma-I factor RsgI6-like n=1 Tax=Branchiostoma lanceolatum TaxID=7740 RepID=UPI0034543534
MNIELQDGSDVHLMMSRTSVSAEDGWRRLYGDITMPGDYGDTVSRVWLHVGGVPATVGFLVDGAYLEELPRDSWRAEADARIEQIRKRDVILRINTDSPESVEVEVVQKKSHFAFGSAVNATALKTNGHYRDFFFNNFEWAVIENDLKWQQTDPYVGIHRWPDTVIEMLEDQGVPIRGHCIFWANPERVPWWLNWLSWLDWIWSIVRYMSWQRVDDVAGRYAGRLAHWDVNNEMLHHSYFMDTTGGPQIRYDMFHWAKEKDPNVKLFLNDYNVISSGQSTQAYADQISEFLANGAPVGGIGVQGHFRTRPDPVLIKTRLDLLASSGLPIWVTELDFSEPDQSVKADGYEDAMRAAFSHPAVEGLLIWGFWNQSHWRPEAALVNGDNFKLNEAGRRWQRLVFNDWRTNLSLTDGIVTPEGKEFIFRGFHGNYEVKVKSHGQVVATKTFYLHPEEGSFVVDLDITIEE